MGVKLPNYDEAKNRSKVDINYLDVDNNIDDIYKGKKYFLRTYGCQMNVHDSEQIAFYLEKLGCIKTETLEESDIIVLNTCAVRENAHEKVVGFLGRCHHLKKEKKDLIICVMGCLAGQTDVVEDFQKNHKYIDIIIGPNNIYDLPRLLIEKSGKQNIEVHSNSDVVPENIIYNRDSNISAWVNIMYGCDKFCTYCIVPFTRGRERSRKIECILNECEKLVKDGYQEITLLGQNVNAYGKDLYDDYNLGNLLEEIAKKDIPRIRFMTSHPWDFTDDMIDVIKKYDNIMPSIHLPVQSGSNKVLKLMGRKYTKEEYIDLFDKLKTIPNVTISTDIIVGFPSETEEDFEETLKLCEYCKFDNAYTFIFSPREGTAALKLKDETTLEEKEQRLYKLNELVNSFSLKANKKYLGKTVPVLIEGINEKDDTKVFGYTDTMKLVNVEGCLDKIGEIIDVEITDAKSFSLDGKEKKS